MHYEVPMVIMGIFENIRRFYSNETENIQIIVLYLICLYTVATKYESRVVRWNYQAPGPKILGT
jgi:hypothetical protein